MISATNQKSSMVYFSTHVRIIQAFYVFIHGDYNVLGAAPQTPFSLFFADEVGKKERQEDSRGRPTGTRAPATPA